MIPLTSSSSPLNVPSLSKSSSSKNKTSSLNKSSLSSSEGSPRFVSSKSAYSSSTATTTTTATVTITDATKHHLQWNDVLQMEELNELGSANPSTAKSIPFGLNGSFLRQRLRSSSSGSSGGETTSPANPQNLPPLLPSHSHSHPHSSLCGQADRPTTPPPPPQTHMDLEFSEDEEETDESATEREITKCISDIDVESLNSLQVTEIGELFHQSSSSPPAYSAHSRPPSPRNDRPFRFPGSENVEFWLSLVSRFHKPSLLSSSAPSFIFSKISAGVQQKLANKMYQTFKNYFDSIDLFTSHTSKNSPTYYVGSPAASGNESELALHVLQISHILNISKFPTPQNNVPENVELTSILVDDTSDKLVATASLKLYEISTSTVVRNILICDETADNKHSLAAICGCLVLKRGLPTEEAVKLVTLRKENKCVLDAASLSGVASLKLKMATRAPASMLSSSKRNLSNGGLLFAMNAMKEESVAENVNKARTDSFESGKRTRITPPVAHDDFCVDFEDSPVSYRDNGGLAYVDDSSDDENENENGAKNAIGIEDDDSDDDDNEERDCVSPVPLLTPPHCGGGGDGLEWPSGLVVDNAITKALNFGRPKIAFAVATTGLTPQLSGIAMAAGAKFEKEDEGFSI